MGFASLVTLAGLRRRAPGDGTENSADDTEGLARSGTLDDGAGSVTVARPVRPVGPIGTVVAPPIVPSTGSDLTLDDAVMHFDAGSSQGLDIHVINVGEVATLPSTAAVTVNGIRFVGHVYPYYPATSPADSLVPQTHGYIHLAIPAATLQLNHCVPYSVHNDVDHTMQVASTNRPDVFTNDVGYSWTQCLTWLTPVSSAVMGQAMITAVADQTLHRVVSSQVSGRNDGQLCSSCHYRNASNNYQPEIDQNTSDINILADTVVGGGTAGRRHRVVELQIPQRALPAHR